MFCTNQSLLSCTDLLFPTQQTFLTQNLAAHAFQLIMVFKPSLVQSSVSSAPGISGALRLQNGAELWSLSRPFNDPGDRERAFRHRCGKNTP